MILRCRLCHAAIAAFDPADIIPPLTGAVFGPLLPGFPPPFDPDAAFDDARCPYCRHHPQGYGPAGRDSLETDQGPFVVTLPAAGQPAAGQTAAGQVAKKRGRKGGK